MRPHLEALARRISLGSYLRLGRGEERTGGREKRALLVDAFEALIAAVYLDGGITAAEQFVGSTVLTDEVVESGDKQARAENYKSILQEWLQARKMPPPVYQIEATKGPAHRRFFKVGLRVGDLYQSTAEGWTKKAAEQDAARDGLAFLQEKYPDDGTVPRKAAADFFAKDET